MGRSSIFITESLAAKNRCFLSGIICPNWKKWNHETIKPRFTQDSSWKPLKFGPQQMPELWHFLKNNMLRLLKTFSNLIKWSAHINHIITSADVPVWNKRCHFQDLQPSNVGKSWNPEKDLKVIPTSHCQRRVNYGKDEDIIFIWIVFK